MNRVQVFLSACTVLGVLLALYLLNLLLHLMKNKEELSGQTFTRGGVTTERRVDESKEDFILRHKDIEAAAK